jgi:hypothetical protein
MAGGVGEGCEARKRANKESKSRSTRILEGAKVSCVVITGFRVVRGGSMLLRD